MCSSDYSELKSYNDDGKYLSHEVINELVSLMAMYVLKTILLDIKNVRIYSLIPDEVTDISHKEQVWITFRWVKSDFEIHENTIELIHVPKTDSETIIADCLIQFSLPITQCRGWVYDGALDIVIKELKHRFQQPEAFQL